MAESDSTYAGMSRRSLCIGIGGAATLVALGGLKALPAEARVRPPGNQSEDHFTAACVRCERCIEACPRDVLRPARLEEGVLGVRMPVATFDDNWCNFCAEDNDSHPKCVEACTSGALTLAPDANEDNTVLGKAVIIHDWCIAWAGEETCRHCYKACHFLHDAIILKGGRHPEVDRDLCVGCGACQTACISLGYRSVDPSATSRAIIVVAASEAERLAETVECMQPDERAGKGKRGGM